MNTNTATTMKTVADLIAHVVSECTPVDREERFDQMLDECYSFDSVGGPFVCISPSEALKKCDPVAYRCGVNDYADGEGWIEIECEYYESDDVEKARSEFIDELRSDLDKLTDSQEIEIMEAFIAECEDYRF